MSPLKLGTTAVCSIGAAKLLAKLGAVEAVESQGAGLRILYPMGTVGVILNGGVTVVTEWALLANSLQWQGNGTCTWTFSTIHVFWVDYKLVIR